MSMLAARRRLFCIDDHQLAGGQGQMLCNALAESGLAARIQQRMREPLIEILNEITTREPPPTIVLRQVPGAL